MKEEISQIRSFNRFYTSIIGLLDRQYLDSEFSLTEARILYELYHAPEGLTAKALIELLDLDKGYLSRILLHFEKKKLLGKRRSAADGRSSYLRLTEKGKEAFLSLDLASRQQVMKMLTSLSDPDIARLVTSMNAIKEILAKVNTNDHEQH